MKNPARWMPATLPLVSAKIGEPELPCVVEQSWNSDGDFGAVEHLAERGALHPEIVRRTRPTRNSGLFTGSSAGIADGGDRVAFGDGAVVDLDRPGVRAAHASSSTMSSLGWIAATPVDRNDVARAVGRVRLPA